MAIRGLRPIRVGRFIQQELASILLMHTRNPLLKDVVVTYVKMSPDLHNALIYYRVMGKETLKEYQEALDKSHGFLEKRMGPSLNMAYIPKLSFKYDEKLEEAEKLEHLLREIEGEGENG